jgi:flavin reductase (DIM6/NTAB) family NADH-FMN oxidoreductase RutF
VFSPSRRGRDNTTKHTLENLRENPEAVVSMVDYKMVHQMSLASSDFPKGINEFEKAGFTMLESDQVQPYRVAESPAQFECKVIDIVETGDQGGAGNLVICEIIRMHIDDEILGENNLIDVRKTDFVGRMGGDYYVRANGDAVFEVEKPSSPIGFSIDGLPDEIKFSKILSGNDLGRLGNLKSYPSSEEIQSFSESEFYSELPAMITKNRVKLEHFASELIEKGEVKKALMLLLCTLTE